MAVRDTSWVPPLWATIRRPRLSTRIVAPTTIQISSFLEAAYFLQVRLRIRLRPSRLLLCGRPKQSRPSSSRNAFVNRVWRREVSVLNNSAIGDVDGCGFASNAGQHCPGSILANRTIRRRHYENLTDRISQRDRIQEKQLGAVSRYARFRSCHGEREDQQAANQEWASDRSIAGNRRYRIALSAKPALIHRKEGLKSRQTQCVPFGYPSLPAIPWSDGHESSS